MHPVDPESTNSPSTFLLQGEEVAWATAPWHMQTQIVEFMYKYIENIFYASCSSLTQL